jgi:predicted phage terminase large subunit-like protein
VKEKHVYLLNVFRKRMDYPTLKRDVREQAELFRPQTVLIEDKASGTQLIQELISEGIQAIKKYEPTMDKTMRMNSVTSTIENGFAHLPDKAPWLGEYLHELASFPKGKYDDQVDSTSQALDWYKNCMNQVYGVLEYYQETQGGNVMRVDNSSVKDPTCPRCGISMCQRVANAFRCPQCGAQSPIPGTGRTAPIFNRSNIFK